MQEGVEQSPACEPRYRVPPPPFTELRLLHDSAWSSVATSADCSYRLLSLRSSYQMRSRAPLWSTSTFMCFLSLSLRAGLAVGLGIGALAEVAKKTLRPTKQSERERERERI